MALRRFDLRLELDPPAEDLERLRYWPARSLVPDYIVATSGSTEIRFDGVPVVYRSGRFVRLAHDDNLPEGTTTLIGDYLAGFVQRLVDTLEEWADDAPRFVGFVGNPAGLHLRRAGDTATVGYRESEEEPDLYSVVASANEVAATIRGAAESYHQRLLALNPKLAYQRDVAILSVSLARLGRAE